MANLVQEGVGNGEVCKPAQRTAVCMSHALTCFVPHIFPSLWVIPQ